MNRKNQPLFTNQFTLHTNERINLNLKLKDLLLNDDSFKLNNTFIEHYWCSSAIHLLDHDSLVGIELGQFRNITIST